MVVLGPNFYWVFFAALKRFSFIVEKEFWKALLAVLFMLTAVNGERVVQMLYNQLL